MSENNPPDGCMSDLATALSISSKAVELALTDDPSDLDSAIDMTKQVIGEVVAVDYDPIQEVSNLVGMLSKRYRHTHSQADAELGIDIGNAALQTIDPEDPIRRDLLSNLGSFYRMQYNCLGRTSDLDHAIIYVGTAASLFPKGSTHRCDLQFSHGIWLRDRFEESQDVAFLDSSIIALKEAICMDNLTDPDRPRQLIELGASLGTRFKRTNNIEDLDGAIELYEQAENIAQGGHSQRATILEQLAWWLGQRYDKTRSTADRSRAIAFSEAALLLSPDNAGLMHHLGNLYRSCFRSNNTRADLDRSIECIARSLDLSPPNSLGRLHVLYCYAVVLMDRFQFAGYVKDIEDGIKANREAVEITPKNHPNRLSGMMNLSMYLCIRFEHMGSSEDLCDAISLGEQVLQNAPYKHPERNNWLNIHGNTLGTRFKFRSHVEDLDEAIRLTSEAVDQTCSTNRTIASKLSSYGRWLGERFEYSASIHDLNKAIEATDKAVKATSAKDRMKAERLNNLGRWLARRFERVGALQDVNHAIEMAKRAVKSTPKRDIERPARLNNLSSWYYLRYSRENRKDDLDRSIAHMSAAIEQTDEGHPRRPIWLDNLAIQLRARGTTCHGHENDLDEAVRHLDTALSFLTSNHPYRLVASSGLGRILRDRFILSKRNPRQADDIDRSIKVLTEAVGAIDGKHSLVGWALLNLGFSYTTRFTFFENASSADKEDAICSFIRCFNCANLAPFYRIEGARRAAAILDSLTRSHEALRLLKDAISLFPLLSPRSLPRFDQQHALTQIYGIPAMAAAIALKSGAEPYNALMIMESGRGIIANLLMEMRTDVSILEPRLASEFMSARLRLDTPHLATIDLTCPNMDDEKSWSRWISRSGDLYAAEDELQSIIKKVQADSKTQDFLELPSKDELKSVVGQDTVVIINVTSHRCDAFAIAKEDEIRVIELRSLESKDIETWLKRLRSSRPHIDPSMLEWLWDDIASPILESLGFHEAPPDGDLPRVSWILTGALSCLPIHAAGRHTKGAKETVMDRVMSSYSSSLRGLVHGKRIKSSNRNENSGKKALLIGMSKKADNSELADLPFALKEIEALENLCPRLNLGFVRLPSQSRDAVLAQLSKCIIFHFAGHGRSDPLNPSQSGLFVEDGLLTAADLQACNLSDQGPFLGYLSACWTGANDMDKLADEGIHLIGACKLAGFRHVIGTLWQVFDDSCVEIAESVYEAVVVGEMTDRSVCAGLHGALVRHRDAWVNERLTASREITDNTVGLVDSDAYEDISDQGVGKERHGRLQRKNRAIAALVKAPWIPFVHYGP